MRRISIEGSETILGLNDQATCLNVDLQGIFTAPLGERTSPLG